MTAEAAGALGTADAGVFLAAHCTGQHTLFDPRGEGEPLPELRARHLIALDICTGCPCTTSYAVLLDTLPRASWGGVWAGRSVELPDLTTREDPSLSAPLRHPSTQAGAAV